MKLSIAEEVLLEWLKKEACCISQDEASCDHEFIDKILNSIELLKKLIIHLQSSAQYMQNEEFKCDLNSIYSIGKALVHCSDLVTPQKVLIGTKNNAITEAIELFDQQNYLHEGKLLVNELRVISAAAAEIEKCYVATEDLASNYSYKGNMPEDCPSYPKVDYLIPVKPTEYDALVLNCFKTFFGGYSSSNFDHTRIRQVFKASCFPFDDEHMLVTRDVAQALMLVRELNAIDNEWDQLIENASSALSSTD